MVIRDIGSDLANSRPCRPPNPTARIYACFAVALFSVTGARCRTRAVASRVECSKQHPPTRAATSRWQRWDWLNETTTPPTHPPKPSTGSIASSRVSGAAAVLGRPSSAPDETVCLASRLANWACDTVSAKNSNSYQLAIRRMVEETEALPGEMKLHAPSRLPSVFLAGLLLVNKPSCGLPILS